MLHKAPFKDCNSASPEKIGLEKTAIFSQLFKMVEKVANKKLPFNCIAGALSARGRNCGHRLLHGDSQ